MDKNIYQLHNRIDKLEQLINRCLPKCRQCNGWVPYDPQYSFERFKKRNRRYYNATTPEEKHSWQSSTEYIFCSWECKMAYDGYHQDEHGNWII